MTDKKEEFKTIVRNYNCKICNEGHKIELSRSLVKDRKSFPFPKVFLHGELRDILTILYIDRDLQIRGVEVQKLNLENLFSKEQSLMIADNLTDEIDRLNREIERLKNENADLKKKLGM